jgi:hypothetical protein
MPERSAISWFPPWASRLDLTQYQVASRRDGQRFWQCMRPTAAGWSALGAGLREAQRVLRATPIAAIVEAIDEVSRRWGERNFAPRQEARDEVVRGTGFSPEAVEQSFDVELRNYRAPSLLCTLRRELGTAEVLDGFAPDRELGGRSLALGPSITLAIFSGNVPGLPALSIVRALLVKSAVIAKVASGEPSFAARFARSLHEVMPALGNALAITYWERDDEAALAGALGQSEAVITYGSDEACAAIRARVTPAQRYVEHGHKLSLGVLSQAYLRQLGLDEVARRVAQDVSTFNQHACIAPQAYLVEGQSGELRAFGASLAHALARYATRCPLGSLDEAEAAALQLHRAAAAWTAATGPDAELWRADGLDWTVQLARELMPLSGAGNRVLRIVPCGSLADAVSQIRPIGRRLQNIGLGALPPELFEVATALAEIGACRISEPGHMAEPSFVWRHDGEPCLARLVRWCDLEMHRGARTEAQPHR